MKRVFFVFFVLSACFLHAASPALNDVCNRMLDLIEMRASQGTDRDYAEYVQNWCYNDLAKAVAPLDLEKAQEIVRLVPESKSAFTYLEISKHQNARDAEDTLDHVRDVFEQNVYDTYSLRILGLEEMRRDLPGFDETCYVLMKRVGKNYLTSVLLELEARFDLKLPGFNEAVAKAGRLADEEEISSDEDLYWSVDKRRDLLKWEAIAQVSHTHYTLEWLRHSPEKLYQEAIIDGETPLEAAVTCLDAWVDLLVVEAESPYLRAQFGEDVEKALHKLREFKAQFPKEDHAELEGCLACEFDSFAPHAVQAQTILAEISDESEKFYCMAKLFEEQVKQSHFDKKQGFSKLKAQLKKVSQEDASYHLILARIAHEHVSLKRAQRLIKQAKQLALCQKDNDEKLNQLRWVLSLEVNLGLPGREKTLEMIYPLFHASDSKWALCDIIRAEVSLIDEG